MAKLQEFVAHDVAMNVLEHLRMNRTDRGLRDLGHGMIELLREVTLKISAPLEVEKALRSLASTLLLLKSFLLGWDCSGFPEERFVLPQLAYHASVLKHKHTHKDIYCAEIHSCLLFMADHRIAFQDEPWLWLQNCLMNLHDRLERKK